MKHNSQKTCCQTNDETLDDSRSLTTASSPEKLHTIGEVADIVGVPAWKIRRAVKVGALPHYRFLNSRSLLKLSKVIRFIDASRKGGVI